MGQKFLPDTVNQRLLFAPSLHDWLPEGHLARFLVEVVAELDLNGIYKSYLDKDGRGPGAYAPEVMVRVLLDGYASGVYSSRKMQKHTYEDVAFRYLAGDQIRIMPPSPSFASGIKSPWRACLRKRCCCASKRV
jgi:transposase